MFLTYVNWTSVSLALTRGIWSSGLLSLVRKTATRSHGEEGNIVLKRTCDEARNGALAVHEGSPVAELRDADLVEDRWL